MNERERFDLVYDIGESLLKNGAEIKRVELTIRHVAVSLKLKEFDSFVLINGIFMTAYCDNGMVQARVRVIPISPISLGRIEGINTLSRQMSEGTVTAEEAMAQLKEIKKQNFTSTRLKIVAYAFGSASFCYIFGGTIWDSLGALILGIVLSLYSIFILPRVNMSKIVINVTSSMLVSILACIAVKLFPVIRLNSLIIGGIISLVPGVPLVNGIRYLFNEDYSSGWGQMIDAVVTSLCISVGVGIVLQLFNIL
ncbi:threonine/serine ThrE exporter family protein [Loigolactobacillus backii]|uniref:Uncharacterized protein n=1 Tax=Loigolactobacillus backii TaxID=375175 RepID=A0A192H0T4_9LACO|nr:threonine/serine exporter family protein [Loigolactobacillus backii]ANK61965.1 hypothetical protein AYR53_03785 [Loigolactobacillus backii]ANK65418.1 hypothetical protein AYR54_09325 [Loigolactobacillus backii]ANK68841.1 hypothetical protein AYR56_00940 [Loigolactobacillus backii]MDA5386839.1 threonine/serine exporter family protein [Loigolactobacillus backii]MDA5389376.1 threonine/serine exporter family protein [Loigolactobacillus backii]